MAIDTSLRLYGFELVLSKETAMKVYDLLSEERVYIIQRYQSKQILISFSNQDNISMHPLGSEFEKDVSSAKALGVSYDEFIRNRPN